MKKYWLVCEDSENAVSGVRRFEIRKMPLVAPEDSEHAVSGVRRLKIRKVAPEEKRGVRPATPPLIDYNMTKRCDITPGINFGVHSQSQ